MKPIITVLLFALLFSCTSTPQKNPSVADPLPSWNDGTTKEAIIHFVEEVSNTASEKYVPIPDRIAVFDNDGNLWSEKPYYFQLFFAMEQVKLLAPEHPEWKTTQPFKSLLENDLEKFLSYGEHGILEVVMATHAGNSSEEFATMVEAWRVEAKHPRFNRSFTDLVYQPMLELISYLQENDFKTFIVSGGGIEFMRPWVEEVYNIPKDQVVGSSIKTAFVWENGKPIIQRLPEMDFIDDKEGKPVGINKFIGRRPIFCSGNSDGDLAMMQYTAAGEGARFMLYLHHTDATREWAYDRQSSIGRLDKGLDEATKQGWSVIDMAKDWTYIYPFELQE